MDCGGIGGRGGPLAHAEVLSGKSRVIWSDLCLTTHPVNHRQDKQRGDVEKGDHDNSTLGSGSDRRKCAALTIYAPPFVPEKLKAAHTTRRLRRPARWLEQYTYLASKKNLSLRALVARTRR
jgi:hypothetical protein